MSVRTFQRSMQPFAIIVLLQVISFLFVSHMYHGGGGSSAAEDAAARRILSEENIFASNRWILNHNVSHYSSMVAWEEREQMYEITTLAFIKKRIESADYLRDNLKCIVRVGDDHASSKLLVKTPVEIYEINFKPMFFGPKSVWRVRCNVTRAEYLTHAGLAANTSTTNHRVPPRGLYVALVDYLFFYHWLQRLKLDMRDVLVFQKPALLRKQAPKERAVAHCLHKVIDLTPGKVLMLHNWIDMQRRIGIAKIKMCLFDERPDVSEALKRKYGDYVHITRHYTKLHDVCRWQYRNWLALPNSKIFRFLNRNCKQMYRLHFDLSYYPIFQYQQMMCSQDCYMHFKHQYEYVTNYDFDEIILPRRHGYNVDANVRKLTEAAPTNASNECSASAARLNEMVERGHDFSYKMYDFATDLFNKYGHDNAYVKFKQIVFFPESIAPAVLGSIVKRYPLSNVLENKRFETIRVWSDTKYIAYRVHKNHAAYFDAFKAINRTVACLGAMYARELRALAPRQNVSSHFNLILATEMLIGREGKSIYNTNYTQSYDAHEAKNTTLSAKFTRVPIYDGFIGHFRNDMGKYFNMRHYSFSFIKLDLEYYAFLFNLYK